MATRSTCLVGTSSRPTSADPCSPARTTAHRAGVDNLVEHGWAVFAVINAQTFALREKKPADRLAAVTMRFIPFRFAHPRLHVAGFGVRLVVHLAAAARTFHKGLPASDPSWLGVRGPGRASFPKASFLSRQPCLPTLPAWCPRATPRAHRCDRRGSSPRLSRYGSTASTTAGTTFFFLAIPGSFLKRCPNSLLYQGTLPAPAYQTQAPSCKPCRTPASRNSGHLTFQGENLLTILPIQMQSSGTPISE